MDEVALERETHEPRWVEEAPPDPVAALRRALEDRVREGRFGEARAHADGLLALCQANGDASGAAEAQVLRGNVRCRAGDLAGGLADLRAGLDAARQADTPHVECLALERLGAQLYHVGDRAGALDAAERCVSLAEHLGEPSLLIGALNTLGQVRFACGEFAFALTAYRRALDLAQHELGRPREAALLCNVGQLYVALGDLDRARVFLGRSLDLRRREGNIGKLPLLLANLGSVALDLGLLEESRRCLEEALGLELQTEGQRLVAELCVNLAALALATGDLDAAEARLSEALRHVGRTGVRTTECSVYLEMGELCLRRTGPTYGPALALEWLDRAEAIAREVDVGDQLSACLRLKSRALKALGRIAEALESFEEHHTLQEALWRTAADCRMQQLRGELELEQAQREADRVRLEKEALGQALELAQRLHREAEHHRVRAEHLASIDPLTGVANRRGLVLHLAELWERHRGAGVPLAVCLVDVDHFKQINDRFLHRTGDEVLAELARLLREGSRSADVVARYGGEEFVVILPGVALLEACRVAERLRSSVAHHRWAERCPGLAVTISIGVAEASRVSSPEALLAEADRALYRAKQSGRDRVCVLGGPPPSA